MAAPTRGLTPTDIGAIREQLTAGRKPRIVFTESAGQIAGQQGHVVALTDPAGSDEWIVVQFGRDELPFAPVDLATPTRGGTAARAAAVPSGASSGAKAGPAKRAGRPESEPERPPLKLTEPPAKLAKSAAKSATPSSNGSRPAGAEQAANGVAPANGSRPAASANGANANGASANGASASGPLSSGASASARAADPTSGADPKPAKVAKPKAPASLTVTLSYADREWTVSASLGTRTLAKPYLIKPTEALRMVALVDVPGVHEAVESIIVAERAEAETRAARLRTELAEIETRLAELAGRS